MCVYVKFVNVLVFELSLFYGVKEMMKYVFELSEKFKYFVILRIIIRSFYVRGDVVFGELFEEIKIGKRKFGKFKKDLMRFVDVFVYVRKFYLLIFEKIEKICEEFNNCLFNWIEGKEDVKVGIIVFGLSYVYVKEVFVWFGVEDVKIFKFGMLFFVFYGLFGKFFDGFEKVFIVEEFELVVEE